MAKKNLKAALAGHQSRKASAQKAARAAEAQEQKAQSVKRSVSGISTRAATEKKREKKRRRIDGEAGVEDDLLSKDERVAVRPFSHTSKSTRLFGKDDTVLLVGEGDFSFAVSLIQHDRIVDVRNLLATSYDSEVSSYNKYPNAEANVAKLREAAGRKDVVLFEVDGGNLVKHQEITGLSKSAAKAMARGDDVRFTRRWSKIYWGFPHVGQGHADETRNILANQLAIARFLVSAAPLLSTGPVPSYAQQGGAKKGHLAKSRNRAREAHDGGPASDEEQGSDSDGAEWFGDLDEDEGEGEMKAQLKGDAQRALPKAPNRAGSILISLRQASPYTLWELPKLAKSLPILYPQLLKTAPPAPKSQAIISAQEAEHAGAYRVWRSFDFFPRDYEGYKHVRTDGKGVEGNLLGDESKAGCRCWELGRVSPM